MKENQTSKELNEEEIRVLKTASCPSLSGRSDLTYEIGCDGGKAIYIRLTANTGAGMFSKAWIPLAQIAKLLSADDKPITSKTLRSLYTGSSNSCGFFLALMKNEGLIKNIEPDSRGYVRIDPKKFTAEIHALIESPPKKETAKEKKALPAKPLNGEAG